MLQMQLMGTAVLPQAVLETQIALALNTNAQGAGWAAA